jgi:hypothetical protein
MIVLAQVEAHPVFHGVPLSLCPPGTRKGYSLQVVLVQLSEIVEVLQVWQGSQCVPLHYLAHLGVASL